MYEEGYSSDNLRTFTIDYTNVFTLVDSTEVGVDGEITIDVTYNTHGENLSHVSTTSYGRTVLTNDAKQ